MSEKNLTEVSDSTANVQIFRALPICMDELLVKDFGRDWKNMSQVYRKVLRADSVCGFLWKKRPWSASFRFVPLENRKLLTERETE